jgi:hypothetical protein
VLGEQLAGQARQYEQIHTARLAWAAETAPAKDAAEAARTELARRQADQQARTRGGEPGHQAEPEPAQQAGPGQEPAAARTTTATAEPAVGQQQEEPAPEAAAGEHTAAQLRDLTAALEAAQEAIEKIQAREAERAEQDRRHEYDPPGHRYEPEPHYEPERVIEADRDGPELEP